MENKLKKIGNIIIAILIPLGVGLLSAFITKDAMDSFSKLNQPPLSPPSILFPIVWTILYTLMGIASYLIYKSDELYGTNYRRNSLILYIIQLILNFLWSIVFFNAKEYILSFIILIVLWLLIILLIVNSSKINKKASYLLIPYLIWTTFAGYLNIMIAILN